MTPSDLTYADRHGDGTDRRCLYCGRTFDECDGHCREEEEDEGEGESQVGTTGFEAEGKP